MALNRVRTRLGRLLGARAVAGVAALTVALTCAFVGVLALVRGEVAGVEGRLPYYVLAMALAFVAAVFRLDDRERSGTQVLTAVAAVSVATFALVALAVEGIVYGVTHSEHLVASQILVYFAAASLICTGMGVWGLRHWREFAGAPAE